MNRRKFLPKKLWKRFDPSFISSLHIYIYIYIYIYLFVFVPRSNDTGESPRVITWHDVIFACIPKHKRATQNEYRSCAPGRGFRSENYSGSGRIMDYKWWIALKPEYVTSVNVLFLCSVWLTLREIARSEESNICDYAYTTHREMYIYIYIDTWN